MFFPSDVLTHIMAFIPTPFERLQMHMARRWTPLGRMRVSKLRIIVDSYCNEFFSDPFHGYREWLGYDTLRDLHETLESQLFRNMELKAASMRIRRTNC